VDHSHRRGEDDRDSHAQRARRALSEAPPPVPAKREVKSI
jgi:hypothetical protein